jgi:hypothetical protein
MGFVLSLRSVTITDATVEDLEVTFSFSLSMLASASSPLQGFGWTV